MRDYQKYIVWQKSHQFVLEIYRITKFFPKEELFALTNQMKRSSSSIPTNIAEGCGRDSDKDFCKFLFIAYGSANELEYQIILSRDLNFINSDESEKLLIQIEEIKKMLNSLIKQIKTTAKS